MDGVDGGGGAAGVEGSWRCLLCTPRAGVRRVCACVLARAVGCVRAHAAQDQYIGGGYAWEDVFMHERLPWAAHQSLDNVYSGLISRLAKAYGGVRGGSSQALVLTGQYAPLSGLCACRERGIARFSHPHQLGKGEGGRYCNECVAATCWWCRTHPPSHTAQATRRCLGLCAPHRTQCSLFACVDVRVLEHALHCVSAIVPPPSRSFCGGGSRPSRC